MSILTPVPPNPENDYDNDLTPDEMTPYTPGHVEDPDADDFYQYVVDYYDMVLGSVEYFFRFIALAIENTIYAIGTIIDEIHEPLSFLPIQMIVLIDLSIITIIAMKFLKR